jgi:hypothetical protein
MNVGVKTVDALEAGSAAPKKRKTLVVTKDIAAGEVIYEVGILKNFQSSQALKNVLGTSRGRGS